MVRINYPYSQSQGQAAELKIKRANLSPPDESDSLVRAAADLCADSYELNHALCVALETHDAEARWLKGEDVFAGVACESCARN